MYVSIFIKYTYIYIIKWWELKKEQWFSINSIHHKLPDDDLYPVSWFSTDRLKNQSYVVPFLPSFDGNVLVIKTVT